MGEVCHNGGREYTLVEAHRQQNQHINDKDCHLPLLGKGVLARVTGAGGVSGDRRSLISGVADAKTCKDGFLHGCLIPVTQLIVVKRVVLAFLVSLAQFFQPLFIGFFSGGAYARLVLIGAHDHLVLDIWVRSLTTKASIPSSQLTAGTE